MVISAPGVRMMNALTSSPWRVVRHADDGRHRDVGVGHEDLLDLARVHVEATADDHVLGAVDDVVEAVLVPTGQVAGAEPAVPHHLGRGLGAVVVALHDVVTADGDLTDAVSAVDRRSSRSSTSWHSTPQMGTPIEPGRGAWAASAKVASGEVSDRP